MANKQNLVRAVLASLLSSRLTTSELRQLAKLVEGDASFRAHLSHALYETSVTLHPERQSEFLVNTPLVEPGEDLGLVEFALEYMARRKIPKKSLISLLNKICPAGIKGLSEKDSARRIVQKFLQTAPTRARQEFLGELGVDVREDPYLGGISRRF